MYELLPLAKHRETSLQLQFTNMAQFDLIATQLEDAIREAEEEAETRLKMTLPDDPYIRIGEIVSVLTLTAPTGPAAPSQCPFRVRTGHPIIA